MPTNLSTQPLKARISQLRRELGVSWRHIPIRLGIDRRAVATIRFSDRLDTPSAIQVAVRLRQDPSLLWPELASASR